MRCAAGIHRSLRRLAHRLLIPDFIVDDLVIVDTKVVTSFNDSHLAQMLGYLNITGLKTALLLNFKYSRLQIKRISN